MFGDGMQKNELPLIIVCDDKDMVYANYLIQLIGQKDDAGDSIVGVEDDSVSAAIYTVKNYKDNLPTSDDVMMVNFLIDSGIPFVVILTKADKLSKKQREERRASLLNELPCAEDITIIEFSAQTGEGRDEIRAIIEEIAADDETEENEE